MHSLLLHEALPVLHAALLWQYGGAVLQQGHDSLPFCSPAGSASSRCAVPSRSSAVSTMGALLVTPRLDAQTTLPNSSLTSAHRRTCAKLTLRPCLQRALHRRPRHGSAWTLWRDLRAETLACGFTAHSTTWDPEIYPFDGTPQHILDTIRLLEPITWASVPLALRITFPDASTHALRRRRLPHGEQMFIPLHGAKLSTASGATPAPSRFRRNTQSVLRLVLAFSGADLLVQDGYKVELLPKLAFFALGMDLRLET